MNASRLQTSFETFFESLRRMKGVLCNLNQVYSFCFMMVETQVYEVCIFFVMLEVTDLDLFEVY